MHLTGICQTSCICFCDTIRILSWQPKTSLPFLRFLKICLDFTEFFPIIIVKTLIIHISLNHYFIPTVLVEILVPSLHSLLKRDMRPISNIFINFLRSFDGLVCDHKVILIHYFQRFWTPFWLLKVDRIIHSLGLTIFIWANRPFLLLLTCATSHELHLYCSYPTTIFVVEVGTCGPESFSKASVHP